MIHIQSEKECCGCEACKNKCPLKCITMQVNQEGFLYPIIDKKKCINCHLCEKVCPMLHPYSSNAPYKVLGIKNKNVSIQKSSASGGLFSILAETVINKGGCVFGAAFTPDWNVKHICATTLEELIPIKGSKYLQSHINDVFQKVEQKLKLGILVLFSGTPCQISGLKHYLTKEYPNLYTAEIICHSVISPQIWQNYLQSVSKGKEISSINFRDKQKGWKNYTLSIKGKHNRYLLKDLASENFYMRCIFKGILSRYSCYECQAKNGMSSCDITIGDFWGIENIDKAFYDKNGVSIALLRNPRIEDILDLSKCEYKSYDYNKVISFNHAIETSLPLPILRDSIYKEIKENGINILSRYGKVSLKLKLKNRIKLYIKAQIWKRKRSES